MKIIIESVLEKHVIDLKVGDSIAVSNKAEDETNEPIQFLITYKNYEEIDIKINPRKFKN